MLIYLVACGSFSPITFAHLRMMECAKEIVQSNYPEAEIFGILSPVNDAYGKKGLVSAKHRIEMCRLATYDSDWINVDIWESEQPNQQETIKVLDHFVSENDVRVMLVCGSDLLNSFNAIGVWSDEDVSRIVDHGIVVISRPGTNIKQIIDSHPVLNQKRNNILCYENEHINNLSSTYVRRLVSENKSITYLVPRKVESHILENNLFKF